ncbi:hypothetical protein [Uliginosibacterium sediminicola]|uniref:Uncharacterized protein n=1 Tax=Uliginosibacterium sediminicola TaxID=2024550 RepID=A0ABU9Z192_9RHOO
MLAKRWIWGALVVIVIALLVGLIVMANSHAADEGAAPAAALAASAASGAGQPSAGGGGSGANSPQDAEAQPAPPSLPPGNGNTLANMSRESLAQILQLDQIPSGESAVQIDGRLWQVIGAKKLGKAEIPGITDLVALRDPESGQLSYRQAGLTLVMATPGSAASYAAAHPELATVFANSNYIQVAVGVDKIGEVQTRLRRDQRIASANLIPAPTPQRYK